MRKIEIKPVELPEPEEGKKLIAVIREVYKMTDLNTKETICEGDEIFLGYGYKSNDPECPWEFDYTDNSGISSISLPLCGQEQYFTEDKTEGEEATIDEEYTVLDFVEINFNEDKGTIEVFKHGQLHKRWNLKTQISEKEDVYRWPYL